MKYDFLINKLIKKVEELETDILYQNISSLDKK